VTPSGGNQAISISTTDCTILNIYDTTIRASFVTPTVTASDNTEVKFLISIEDPNPCEPLLCQANFFSAFDPLIDKLPTDFSVWTNNTLNKTTFSNFRDSKSDKCDGKSGTLNGVAVPLFVAPVCGYPTYSVNLANGASLTSIFGGSNVNFVLNNGLWEL